MLHDSQSKEMNINKKRRTPEKRNKINDKRYNQSAWKGSNGVRQAALKRDKGQPSRVACQRGINPFKPCDNKYTPKYDR